VAAAAEAVAAVVEDVVGAAAAAEAAKSMNRLDTMHNFTVKNPEANSQVGIGWRPEMALAISRRSDLKFVEIVAENHLGRTELAEPLQDLRTRGVEIIPHCISLAPGGAQLPDASRVRRVNRLALQCGAPFVSDHLCFVRAAGMESGHLMPVTRSREALRVVIDNIRFIKENLSVPFAIENIASICDWQNGDFDEASFLAEVLEESDCLMLLDVANLYANSVNHRFDPVRYLERLPLHRLAYVHVAGGTFHNDFYHDTHAHRVIESVYALLQVVCEMATVKRVMLERDDHFPNADDLNAELDKIKQIAVSSVRRDVHHVR
jgi:uncharacterized protein (UPF0276 family)